MHRRCFTKYALALAGALLFLGHAASAQTQTNVTARVLDPLGIPYSNGTYNIQLIPTGNNPSVNGQAIGGAFNGSTDGNGRFNVSLWPNASISPAGTTWRFTICVSPGVAPPLGSGGQCTPPTAVTISGTSQDLSVTLSAVAPGLTAITLGTGSVSSVSATAPIVVTPSPITGVGTISCPTCNTSSATIAGSIALNQVAVGSGPNTISGSSNFVNNLLTGEVDITSPSGGEALFLIPNTGTGNQVEFLANGVGLQVIPSTTNAAQLALSAGGLAISASATAGTQINFFGATSGSGALGVAATAGTPNRMNIPTATGGANQFLITDGNNPQQLSWSAINSTNCPTCVLTNQSNVYTTGLQDFTAATMEIPEAAGFTANVNSTIGLDTTANAIHMFVNNADSLNVVEAAGITANVIPKSTNNTQGLITASLATDNGTTFTYTGTGGVSAPILTSTANGAASTPSVSITGLPFTGGTTTTTVPLVYINSGAAPSSWSTSGTTFGINAPSGFAGNLVDVKVNGSGTLFSINSAGSIFTNALIRFTTTLMPNSGHIIGSSTAPTIAAAGCGGAAASIVVQNGTFAFSIGVGTTPTSACTVTMPAATTNWVCHATDVTTQSTSVFLQKKTNGASTTSVVITNFNTAGTATAFVASDVVDVQCTGD